MGENYLDRQQDSLELEEAKPQLKQPRMFKVILFNDDYTPMEFVVLVLKELFFMDEERATGIMLQVHTQGKGVCGVFTHDVAASKMKLVNDFARRNEHPLFCDLEPE